MTRLLPAAAALLALTLPLAVPGEAREARDARLASRSYNANEVVRVDGRAGVQAAIAFAEDEHIENVAIGDAASWQVTPNKRATMLFVKPLAASARTNMTVVTDRRSYFFDLVASPKAQPLYVLRFTYPDEPGAKRSPGAQRAATAVQLGSAREPALPGPLAAGEAGAAPGTPEVAAAAVEDDLAAPGRDPAALNFAWESKGKRKLLPTRVYDDGRSTYLSWAADTAMPAILVRDARGSEGPVNFAVRDDVIVIEGVPRLLVLRSGKDEATLEYRRGARSQAAPVPQPRLAAQPAPSASAVPGATVVARASDAQPSPASTQEN